MNISVIANICLVKYFPIKYSDFVLDVVIIVPPMVQLNTPYPSGAYLSSFFQQAFKKYNNQGSVRWFDFSTELFHKIFCKEGLSFIFEKTSTVALKKADTFERNGDENSAFQIRRYVAQSKLWCDWIEKIIAIVCSGNKKSGREFAHEFVRSAHIPRGNRVEQYLSGLNREVSVDDAQILASLSLADIADYISVAYDKNFALIRYAEALATSLSTFNQVEKELNAPVLEDFLKSLIFEKIGNISKKTLFCISIPFPGTFEAALYSAKVIKEAFGKNAIICFGGGYVNTELRNVSEKRLFNYCDFLSYDKGYGSYLNIFDSCGELDNLDSVFDGRAFYKIKYLFDNKIVEPLQKSPEYEKLEKECIRNIVPDFSDIDFTKCPRLADSQNAMHRIWNDGAWLKVYLAYGCYWAKCAFCDTSLDYVNGYCNTDISALYDGMYQQCRKTGVYGLHFVDEACPPLSLEKFALKNIIRAKTDTTLTFWGNIRFEKTFTRDLADLLSYGGLTAVSGGIEIATGNGLDAVNKGTTLENIVAACCAFKEAGILVHSYMIFGFWNQSEQDLINSMETLRQLFAAGIMDSAFWHKFTLTLHSTVYKEWLEGKHPDLKPIKKEKEQFAENDICFEGQEKSEKYSGPLNEALNCWMNGEKLKKNVEAYFPFKMPSPSIPKNYVENLIEKYEQKRDRQFSEIPSENRKLVWLGGKILLLKSGKYFQFCWSYMGELLYADYREGNAEKVCDFINSISAENYSEEDSKFFCKSILSALGKKLFLELRGKGLCLL